MSDTQETLDLDAVAALFHAEAETIVQYARTGELPGTRIGKGWIFLREDALGFLRQRIDKDTAARRAAHARVSGEAPAEDIPGAPKVVGVLVEPRPRSRRAELPPLPALASRMPSP
jgi:hypothetical protein